MKLKLKASPGVSKLLFLSFSLLFTVSIAGSACAPKSDQAPTERVWQGVDSSGNEQYLTLRSDEKDWVLTRFVAQPGKLQDLVEESRFSEVADAERAAGRIADAIGLMPRALSPSESRLRDQIFQPVTETPGQVLWNATQSWNWEWEVKFSKWISSELSRDLFVKLKISTDCADLPYVLRWIFARINGLPAANRLAGSKQFFSNESVRESWLRLPTSTDWKSDTRFLAAVNYLMINTYTHTLNDDSYPIRITPESMIPGAFYINLDQDSGHTQVVYELNSESKDLPPLEMIYSTVPREVRALLTGTFWESVQPNALSGGFMRFRWPVRSERGDWTLVTSKQMPHYSKEQFAKDFTGQEQSFSEAVEKRIAPHYDPLLRLRSGIQRLREKVALRQEFVLRGFDLCSQGQCPKGSRAYEDWSTPMRDKSLGELIVKLDDFVIGKAETRPDLSQEWDAAMASVGIKLSTGESLTLGEIRQIWSEHRYSSEPWDPITRRWGIE